MSPDDVPVRTLRIQPLGLSLPVAPGQSLLEAARAAGAKLPSLCRNGSCRECIARVLAGTVQHRIEWPGLSADEKAEGWILPCVALAASDVTLWQPQARAG
jgi:ferredoxin